MCSVGRTTTGDVLDVGGRLVHRSRRCAFTLIELLAVVAIVGLLIGILLPATAAARQAASRSTCAGQLHAIGVAFTQYAMGHSFYPTYGSSATQRARNYLLTDTSTIEDWTALYTGGHLTAAQVLFCPSTTSLSHQFDNPQNTWSAGSLRTGYSRRFVPGAPRTHISNVTPGTVLAADLIISPSRLNYQHQLGCNVLYADGAVCFRADVADAFAAAGVGARATANNAQLDAVWAALDLSH